LAVYDTVRRREARFRKAGSQRELEPGDERPGELSVA
jgi:hypothetical protein